MPRMRKDQRLKKQHRQSFSSFQCKVGVHQPGRTRWGGMFEAMSDFLPNHNFELSLPPGVESRKGFQVGRWFHWPIAGSRRCEWRWAVTGGGLHVRTWEGPRGIPKVSRSCPSPTCHRKENFPPWDRSHEIPDSGHDDRIQFDYVALKLLNVHFVR